MSVGRSLGKLTPKQLGDEDEIDEDVRAEMDRVHGGGADGDVVKVSVDDPLQWCSLVVEQRPRYMI